MKYVHVLKPYNNEYQKERNLPNVTDCLPYNIEVYLPK